MKKRLNAEWERQLATILAMPHKDSDWQAYLAEAQAKVIEIATQIARFQPVIMLYKYESDVEKLKNKHNIYLANIATNDTWCRDFAPICLTQKKRDSMPKSRVNLKSSAKKSRESRLFVLDFVFNAWGGKFASNLDNLASKALLENLKNLHNNIKYKEIDLILEGGSIECNGDSTLLTTRECLLSPNRNRKSKTQLTKKLKSLLCVKKVLWLKNGFLAGDDTDCHIDNLARFVKSDTIVYLKCYDKSDIHFEPLNAMESELKAMRDRHNKPFVLVPLPLPKPVIYDGMRLPASYVNFVLVNGAVLVPTFGADSSDENDKVALSTFAKLFGDREIIAVDSRILVRQGGGMHCMSMQIPAP